MMNFSLFIAGRGTWGRLCRSAGCRALSVPAGHCALLLLLLVFGLTAGAQAATINATSPSRADVGNAVAAAANGDTVVIPAGTATWTTGLTLTKAITLQGAGIGRTIIRDAIASGYVINCTLVADRVTRITGIEFNDNGAAADWRFRFSGTSIDGRRLRVDNCKFDSLSGPVFLFYTVLGVIDHNVIIGRSSGVPAFLGHIINSSWGYAADVPAWGDGAFVEGDQFGTDKFLFFENNNITNLYAPSALTMLDGHSGSRYVARFNNIHKGSFEIHGAEASRTRSGRAYEIYGNTFTSDNTRSSPTYMRGGVGLIYSNSFSGWTASAHFSLLDNRLLDHLFQPFHGADGRNPWDKNNPGNPFASATVTSSGPLMVTDSTKNWTLNQWAGYTIRRTSGKSVSSLTRNGSTATVNCTGHGFTTGDQVSIWGASQQPFNGTFSVSVVNANQFSFTINLPPAETSATGTIKCARGNSFSLIIANTANQVTFASSLYGSAKNLSFSTGDTFEINKVDQSMDQIGVIGGSALGGANVPSAWVNTQTVSPWYEWANTREGGADVSFSTGFGGGGNFPTVKANTHYFNNTPKPGYTPYTYPHPLVSGMTNNPVANYSPTISGIADQTLTAGANSAVLNFNVADAETAAGSLSVSAGSSNPLLLPVQNLVFGGSGGARTLTISPVPGQLGSSTVTVTVSDGQATAVTSFLVSVSAPQIGQLVAAYSFNEGSGTLVADLSGNANIGTLNGATWTAAGKFGGGLSFNGAGRVTVPDSSSLDLTSGMTLEAWVNPAVTANDWSTVLIKVQPLDLVYGLYAATPGNVADTQVVTSVKTSLEGVSGLPMNTWSHLAATYDGATLRLFVNGAQIGSRPVSGSVVTSAGELMIGGENIWGKYFRGILDEVRIYNHALSVAEIQADMNTPLGGVSPKPVAPSPVRVVAAP